MISKENARLTIVVWLAEVATREPDATLRFIHSLRSPLGSTTDLRRVAESFQKLDRPEAAALFRVAAQEVEARLAKSVEAHNEAARLGVSCGSADMGFYPVYLVEDGKRDVLYGETWRDPEDPVPGWYFSRKLVGKDSPVYVGKTRKDALASVLKIARQEREAQVKGEKP